MLVDFQKAFDSWNFLSNVNRLMFSTNIKGSVQQSGFWSRSLNTERGYRQGDPISAYVFLLCAQIFFLMADNTKSITEISIKECNYKITQFADDTTYF